MISYITVYNQIKITKGYILHTHTFLITWPSKVVGNQIQTPNKVEVSLIEESVP